MRQSEEMQKRKNVQQRKTGSMLKHKMRGFSLIELMIVVAVLLIMCSIGTITLMPILKDMHTSNAYNTTLATMRLARQMAIGKRNVYSVTFNNAVLPNTITITDTNPLSPGVVETVPLPTTDVAFDNEPGIPNSNTTTPDQFGTGNAAIGFDQGIAPGVPNIIYFMPDGSAQDVGNNINNGIIYIAQTGVLRSSRAITLWGATGRLRGWRLTQVGAGYQWSQQ
jgi:prepilin-type N-terminal cleavage/methylation domain-containing protein